MNKEEIEELKDFTIDLTDIDELALGLEVCSNKSNMVIQEFANTIIQLQQENKKLNGVIQTYDILLKSNVEENDKLKKQLEEKENIVCNWKDGCLENAGKIEKLETQQKEFISYLEDEINKFKEQIKNDDIWHEVGTDINFLILKKQFYLEILQKYKEIIGGK